ncbi:MAG: dihydropteroate synthase [Verrucomicrobia bacterium]|nr:MAG: dihydropteroate synthase [Verrucomicrobiota bacterium]
MTTRRIHNWQCRDRTVVLGRRTLVMGILNVTPDSFSDGGNYSDPSAAVARALEMAAQGADIIDIGGESTRPGAQPVPIEEEIRRVVPVIEKIREQSDVLLSIDTMKAETAGRALEAGADIINDISAFETDPRMVDIAAETQAGVVLMHMKGSPQTMQSNPVYDSVVQEVGSYLDQRIRFAEQNGVRRECIVADPGIGFGKTSEHNLELLRGLPELAQCGCPVLVGASRKSFIGKVLDRENPSERRAGSLGAAAWAVQRGAHILRVHDVIDTCDVCRLVDTLLVGEHSCS